MNLVPRTNNAFSEKEYWESFFRKRGSEAFEWYGDYDDLSKHLKRYVKMNDDVLIPGCGNSTLGRELNTALPTCIITCIDISKNVVQQMCKLDASRVGVSYVQMDALHTTFKDATFSVVLDKGTLDALVPTKRQDSVKRADKYLNEMLRILKPFGRLLIVSLLQRHIFEHILYFFQNHSCMVRVLRVWNSVPSPMPVFLVVATKLINLPKPVFEYNWTTSDHAINRATHSEQLLEEVCSLQRAALICKGLRNHSIAGEGEVMLKLHERNGVYPKYVVYVVDVARYCQKVFAAFIVPQGRETEWLFSTPAGRQKLTDQSGYGRLAIITLCRHFIHASLADTQQELATLVLELAPRGRTTQQIPYLSVQGEMGERTVIHEGESALSGPYVVEDVLIDEHKLRRLIYLNSQNIVQSEAQVKTVRRRRGSAVRTNEVVDLSHLTCQHHIYMSVAAHLACNMNKKQKFINHNTNVLVIGLGGGGLCMFLNHALPQSSILAVDIDAEMLNIATNWFGFKQSNRLTVHIEDGINYLHSCANQHTNYPQHFDAVLFDVDSKDSSIGMSCPPKAFLELSVLEDVSTLIDKGVFVLNLVLRDKQLRVSIVNTLHQVFKNVVGFALEEELNEVLLCSNSDCLTEVNIVSSLRALHKLFNDHHSTDCDCESEINNLLRNMVIIDNVTS